MSISGRPEIEGGVSKDEGEENTRKRASSSFETRAAHAPQDEEALHPIALARYCSGLDAGEIRN
ncbi:hypothetical protein IYW40_07630 [Methylocystis sp. H4A]|uniref:hypothetical protein n=1 Tax=Methylocystis sp. H4A TaxID=2785788 RepID=UPI0018C2A379|nr:hypothetical protein [Methylocystis sp. H4A]MBG0801350.1 hypothetical protein [Methylocystis sp. H4A]